MRWALCLTHFFLFIGQDNLPISTADCLLNMVEKFKSSKYHQGNQHKLNKENKTEISCIVVQDFRVTNTSILQEIPENKQNCLWTSSFHKICLFPTHLWPMFNQSLSGPYIVLSCIHTERPKVLQTHTHTHCTGYNALPHPHTKRLRNRDLHCDAILFKCDARSRINVTESSDVV